MLLEEKAEDVSSFQTVKAAGFPLVNKFTCLLAMLKLQNPT
jgi:hypothetical protein